MTYQNVLPFDESYGWYNLIKNLKKLEQGQKIVYYGLELRKITIRRIFKERYLVTSYSLNTLKFNIEHDRGLSFREVEFMSTVLKPIEKHVHSYRKSLTKNADWRKQTYNCTDPDCRTYQQAQHILGKTAKCAKCGESTVVDYEQIRHRNRLLVCLNCSRSPKKEVVKVVSDEITKLFDYQELGIIETPKENEVTEESEVENES